MDWVSSGEFWVIFKDFSFRKLGVGRWFRSRKVAISIVFRRFRWW